LFNKGGLAPKGDLLMSNILLKNLESDIETALFALRINFKKVSVAKDISVQYLIEDFGIIVCGIERRDYTQVNNAVQNVYEGWKLFHISTNENMVEKKDDLIWELMRSGYMIWIRNNFPRQFKQLIVDGNFGLKIINERLRIWNNEPRFKFLVEINEAAKTQSMAYLLSIEPGFFDYMP
jgi:hypothetical protein